MAQKKLPEQFPVDSKTKIDDVWLRRLLDVLEARIGTIELKGADFDDATAKLLTIGLARINEIILPAIEEVQELSGLGFLIAHSQTSVSLILDQVTLLTIPPGTERKLFTPSTYIILTRDANIDDWAVLRTASYNAETGDYLGTIVARAGAEGPFSDWTLGALAGTTIAQTAMLEEARDARDTTVLAKTQVVSIQQDLDELAAQMGLDAAAVALAKTQAQGFATAAGGSATDAGNYATLASKWASNAHGVTVAGAGTYSALHYSVEAQGYASTAQAYAVSMSLINGTDYSAKYWANQASLQGVPVGSTIWQFGNGTTTPPGYLKVVPGLEITNAYPELRAWALANGWSTNGSGNPVFPAVESFFPRAWRPGQTGNDGGRVFGSVQQDAFQGHFHETWGHGLNVTSGSVFVARQTADVLDPNTGTLSIVQKPTSDGVNGTPRTAAETRPVNLTFTVYIKAYNQAVDAATVAAAQVLADLADARARVAALEGRRVKSAALTSVAGDTALDFVLSGNPDEIIVDLQSLGLSGTDQIVVQIGDATALLTSGYNGEILLSVAGSNAFLNGAGLGFPVGGSAANRPASGRLVLRKVNNVWVANYAGGFQSPVAVAYNGGGEVALANPVTRLRVTRTGSNTFAAGGSAQIEYRKAA